MSNELEQPTQDPTETPQVEAVASDTSPAQDESQATPTEAVAEAAPVDAPEAEAPEAVETAETAEPDGSYACAEALSFVPNVKIGSDVNGGRKLEFGAAE